MFIRHLWDTLGADGRGAGRCGGGNWDPRETPRGHDPQRAGGDCGPGGRGGFGRGRHGAGFGWGARGGFGFPPGRKLSASDLQLLLLALLGEQPRHGYDLIKAIEEHSNGVYVPSPGVIYPALTYLEEAGDAGSENEGARKVFRLTELGQEHLKSQRTQADAILANLAELGKNMDRMREAFSRGTEGDEFDSLRELWANAPELLEGLRQIRDAIAAHRRQGRPNWSKIAEILKQAAREIHPAKAPGEAGTKP
jgi:DNA-binding PadR family transcriptional regulator